MQDSIAHLRNVLRATGTNEGDDEFELPSLIDGPYQPFARPANKPVYSIHFVSPAGTVTSFQYVHLDSSSTFSAECITLQFIGASPKKVTIHGRNLWRLYDYIHAHRMTWVMAAGRDRDFASDGEPVVTRVEFTPFEPAD